MVELVKSIEGQNFSSIFIVVDLHDCYSLLMSELAKHHFDFESDLLICAGDLIDRGDENLECIRLLEQP